MARPFSFVLLGFPPLCQFSFPGQRVADDGVQIAPAGLPAETFGDPAVVGDQGVGVSGPAGGHVAFDCDACHSVDGTKEGHSGPTWTGLYGSQRRFIKGAPRVADDAYLLESMLEPGKTVVEGYALGMGSYAGVLSDTELKSIVLYIATLK